MPPRRSASASPRSTSARLQPGRTPPSTASTSGGLETAGAIEPWSIGGGYVNYMQADEPVERLRAAFGEEAFERLRALKSRYDPENVLHRNQNIPPLEETARRRIDLTAQASCRS